MLIFKSGLDVDVTDFDKHAHVLCSLPHGMRPNIHAYVLKMGAY